MIIKKNDDVLVKKATIRRTGKLLLRVIMNQIF